MELITTKIVVAILFGIGRFFFGTLPVKLYHFLRRWEEEDDSPNFVNEKRHNQVNCAIALCQSFGGGVLFATCFLHMMVEVYKSIEDLKRFGNFSTEYPFSQLTVCIGFFTVYFLEEISHWFITKIPAEPCQSKKINNLSSRTLTPTNKISPSTDDYIIEEEIIEEKKNKEEDLEKEDRVSSYMQDENKKKLQQNGNKKNKEAEDMKNEERVSSYVQDENKKNLQQIVNIVDLESETIKTTQYSNGLLELDRIANTNVITQQQIMRCIFIVMALSFHAIFEGLAIGLQMGIANIWYLFTAVTIHSATILFCMGLELLIAKTKTRIIIIQMFILAITSPFGVILGLIITLNSDLETKAKSTAIIFLEALSTGTILYITFFEVLNREKERRVYRLYRGICIIGGFAFMAMLQYYEVYH